MKIPWNNRVVQTVAILTIVAAITTLAIWVTVRVQMIYIGVATPASGRYADEAVELLNGAQIEAQALNQNPQCRIFLPFNSNCGIKGRKVQIIPIETAADVNKVIAVLGDFNNSSGLTGISYYDLAGIPTILATSNGEIEGHNNAYRVVADYEKTGTYLANYARQDIGSATASIIFDSTDPASMALVEGFKSPYISLVVQGSRGKITKEWDLASFPDPQAAKDTIISNILNPKRGEEPGLIFLSVNADEAEKLIVEMRRKGVKNTLLGNTDMAGETFALRFLAYPEEQAQSGYFTNGIFAPAPIIFDGANQYAQEFKRTYLSQYKREPSWASATAYDSVKTLVMAFGEQKPTGKVATDRQIILDGLEQINTIQSAAQGISGDTYFESKEAIKPIIIGLFSKDKFISAPVQYYPVDDFRLIPNFNAKVESGQITTLGGRYAYKTDIVYSGININEISGIDENASSYFMDFYLWFRYQVKDPDLDIITEETIQFINATDAPEFELIETRLPAPKAGESTTLDNNLTYKLFRVKGIFTSAFDFKDYPFDQQWLEIRYRHNQYQRQNLVFVVDQVGIRPLDESSKTRVFKSGGDWRMGIDEYFQNSSVIQSSLGNPELYNFNPQIEYSTFNARMPIGRNLFSFMLRNLLPVLFSIALAYLSFYLPRSEFGTREGVLSGTILSIAFFHLSVSSFLSGIGYTTALDNIFYMFYAIILLALGTTLIEWFKDIANGKLAEEIKQLDANTDEGRQKIKTAEAQISRNTKTGLQLRNISRIAYPAILAAMAVGYGIHYWPTISPAGKTSVSPQVVQVAPTEITASPATATVELTLGSWRADDEANIKYILEEFHKQHPNITVTFTPTLGSEYDKIMRLQLERGIAPDLIYLSPAGGRVLDPEQFYTKGYLETLNDKVPNMFSAFEEEDLKTWQTSDGQIYGVPIYAVVHGVFYNKDIFNELNLKIPQTWQEFIRTARIIKDSGKYIPIANGIYERTDPQRVGDYIFQGLAPTYLGGSAGRQDYATGARCFNDPNVVGIYSAIQDMAPFMPENLGTLGYEDSLSLFYNGQAAMFISGSFDINKFKANSSGNWDVFALPAPAGRRLFITFHIDTAIALNANSEHKAEALVFLNWLTENQFGELVGERMPGFYPLQKELQGNIAIIKDENAKAFLNLVNGREHDVRWILPIDKVPDGRTLMQQGAIGVIKGTYSPQQAADILQNGLAQWYPPAQICVPIPTSTP